MRYWSFKMESRLHTCQMLHDSEAYSCNHKRAGNFSLSFFLRQPMFSDLQTRSVRQREGFTRIPGMTEKRTQFRQRGKDVSVGGRDYCLNPTGAKLSKDLNLTSKCLILFPKTCANLKFI